MTAAQIFVLLSAIYLAPHMKPVFGIGIAAIFMLCSFIWHT